MGNSGDISGFGYLGIGVSDMERWRRFATDGVLGFEEMETGSDGTTYYRIDEYHHRFAIKPSGENDAIYLGFEVPSAEDLEALVRRLEREGVAVTRGSDEEKANRKVVDLIKFLDPSGIPLEVFHGALLLWEKPFRPSRAIQGFKTKTDDGDPMGLGHMVLFCKNMDETTRFWRDVLGFKLSDYIDLSYAMPGLGTAVFFHCNPRHHSVAFVEMDVPRHLQHFMVELQSFDDVGSTYDQCLSDGVPLSMSLGKHTNDHMVSFYMVSPSGFDIEYGYGGRLIDDDKWVVQQHIAPSVWGHKPRQAADGPSEPPAEEQLPGAGASTNKSANKKVTIVTGGTYGIGKAITKVLAQRGHQVVAFGLEARQIGSAAEYGIETTRLELEALGLSADLLEADVSNAGDVQRVVDFALAKYGRVDGLVNNAAIHPSGVLLDTDEDVWDKVIDVNLKGVYLTSKAVLAHMVAQGGGSIVNIGSASQWGRSNLLAYCASKGGVYAFSMATAYDYIHDHVRVNMVIPGGAPVTGMTEGLPYLEQAGKQTVSGRNTEPEEIAYAVAYLLSDDAVQVSGSIIDVGCFDHQGGPVRPQEAARAAATNGRSTGSQAAPASAG
jgi:2,3-dihydroxybiphenyl 1,2-dioxygenase